MDRAESPFAYQGLRSPGGYGDERAACFANQKAKRISALVRGGLRAFNPTRIRLIHEILGILLLANAVPIHIYFGGFFGGDTPLALPH